VRPLVTVLAMSLVLSACGGSSGTAPAGTADPLVQPLAVEPVVTTTPTYGAIGSGPVVVVLALDMYNTLYNSAKTSGFVPELVKERYTVVSLDLPCHGADAEPGQTDPLTCWAQRIAAGDSDIFLRFCSGLSDVLDAMKVQSAAILGISRGGYVAATCAAYEPRFKDLIMEIPLTDLNYLTEFKPYPVEETPFNLQQYIPYLLDRARYLSIDAGDVRVGAQLAESFAEQAGMDLLVTNAPNHVIEPSEVAHATAWLAAHPF
jgi:pimeloyl-ACP methyl ester carboxylesterase